MRVKRPFRLAPQSAYIVQFHLSLEELPDNVIGHIIPSERMAEIGVLFTDMYVSKGDLFVTVMPLRMLEVIDGYPLAYLTFIRKYSLESFDTSDDHSAPSIADSITPKKSNVSKGKKNATSSRSKQ